MRNGVLVVAIAVAGMIAGCGTAHQQSVPPDLPDTVTFAADIAPLVRKNCMPCHRPGQAGPFPLITYHDVRKKARTIKLVTGKGYMPPWPADTTYSRFVGERTLTRREVALIARWVDQGALPGDTARLPGPPMYPEGSLFGEPDAVVWLPEAFHIPGDNRDRFMVTKAPFVLERDTFLRAIEFVAGNRRAVHHMNGAIAHYAPGAKQDPFAGERYVDADRAASRDAYARLSLANDDGSYPALIPNAVNYLPGLEPVALPPGVGGYRVQKQGAFVMNTLHYGPSLRDTSDRSRFNLWFAAEPPERPMREIAIGTLGITPVVPELIVPADSIKTFRSSYVLPSAISVITVNPHMHLLGERFVAFAVTGTNDTVPLVRINDWDFRWQYAYTFRHMLHLPQGSTIHVLGTFNNTAANPNNPYSPPREARAPTTGHMRTTDEMFQFFVNYVEHRPGDDTISLAPTDRVR